MCQTGQTTIDKNSYGLKVHIQWQILQLIPDSAKGISDDANKHGHASILEYIGNLNVISFSEFFSTILQATTEVIKLSRAHKGDSNMKKVNAEEHKTVHV